MSKCTDKAKDLAMTRCILNGAASIVDGKSWLRHASKTALVDDLLAKGATEQELIAARPTWKQHQYHLRMEHGLGVDSIDGRWCFTGEADANTERRDLSDEQYRAGYVWGRKVFLHEATKQEGVSEQVKLGTNRNTANSMVHITKKLLSGQNFTRALKNEAYEWYLSWILHDDGIEGLRKALKAAWAHLVYREEKDETNHPRIREILERYERILAGEPDVDNDNCRRGAETALVELRYGQRDFRKNLLNAYGGKCAITGCGVERVLVAAHVRPYALDGESKVSNGILLRADVHALFDAFLLGIDPDDDFSVKLSPALLGSEYEALKKLTPPVDSALHPDLEELRSHLARVLAL